eukprot:172961_1
MSAASSIGYQTFYNGYNRWWNRSIEHAVKKCKHFSRKRWRFVKKGLGKGRTMTQIKADYRYKKLHGNFRSWNHVKSNAIRAAKKRADKRLNASLQNPRKQTKSFYRALNTKRYKSFNVIPPIFTDNTKTNTTNNPIEKATLIHNHISNPPQPPVSQSDANWHNIVHSTVNDIIEHGYDSPPPNTDNATDLFNAPIHFNEIRNCVAELKQDKATGPDDIHNLLIERAGLEFRRLLVDLFNLLTRHHIYPHIWNKANILPIPKPGKDHRCAANFRPIAISSCLGRIFERVISKRLQTFCTRTHLFDNYQCGFQVNRCTDDLLTVFIQDAHESLDKASDLDAVFTDFSKAYDTIWHDGLIYKLNKLWNISGNLLYVIIAFLRGRHTRVQMKDGYSKWRKQNIGVPQGSPLSPILYILYTNDYKIPTTQQKYVNIGLFADDTILWTVPHVKDPLRYKQLQKTLDNFYRWCCKWKLSLNASKCLSMTITNTKETKFKLVKPDCSPHCKSPYFDQTK